MNVSSATTGRARIPAAHRKYLRMAIVALWAASRASMTRGQGPTFPVHHEAPGTTSSSLGAAPGSGPNPFGQSPGGGDMILGGRPGPAFPRVPTAITIPSGTTAAPPPRVIAAAAEVADRTGSPLRLPGDPRDSRGGGPAGRSDP